MIEKSIALLADEVDDLTRRLQGSSVLGFELFEPVDDGVRIQLSVRARAIADVDSAGEPHYVNRFEVDLLVPRGFPTVTPGFCFPKTSDLPFHPWVDRARRIWRAPVSMSRPENLWDWVELFLRSICFDIDVVPGRPQEASDPHAAVWYLATRQARPDLFPLTDLSTFGGLRPKSFHVLSQSPKPDGHGESQAPAKKKFRLVRTHEPYRPKDRPVPRDFSTTAGLRSVNRQQSRYSLTFLPAATERLFRHVGWGETTLDNRVEQGGILLGDVFRDPERRLTYGIVQEIVPGKSARGSSTYLEFGTGVWKEMLDEVDRKLDEEKRELQIIGWYHTHPNTLDVFMSGTDRNTQVRFFAEDWQFSVVLNPHRQIFKVFHGADATECFGNLLLPEWAERPERGEPDSRQPTPVIRREDGTELGSAPPEPPFASGTARPSRPRIHLATLLALPVLMAGALILAFFFSRDPKIEQPPIEKDRRVELKVMNPADLPELYSTIPRQDSEMRLQIGREDRVILLDGEREGYDYVEVSLKGYVPKGKLVRVDEDSP